MLKKYLALIILGLSFTLQASHTKTFNLYWEYTGNNQYVFYLEILKTCHSIGFPTNVSINGPQGSISLSLNNADIDTISGSCSYCLYEKAVLKSNPINLTGTPPPSGWEFSYSICCLTQNNNISGVGVHVSATMYASAGAPAKISTKYNQENLIRSPIAGKYNYNLKPTQFGEADSISVSLAPTLMAANSVNSFISGYSAQFPLPDSSESNLNGPFQFDAQTGLAQYDINNNSHQGYYIYGLQQEYYKDGQVVASVLRNIAHYLYADSTNNTAPTVSYNSGSGANNYAGGALHYTLNLGDTLNLDLTAVDLGQAIHASASGVLMDSAQMNALNLNNYHLAQFTSLNSNGSFTSYNTNQVRFQFAPTLDNYIASAGKIRLLFEFSDTLCHGSRQTLVPVIIHLNPPLQLQNTADTLRLCNNTLDSISASQFSAGTYWSPGSYVSDSSAQHTTLSSHAQGWLYLKNPQYPRLTDSVYIERFDSTGFRLQRKSNYLVLNDQYQNASRVWFFNGLPVGNGSSDTLWLIAYGTYWVEAQLPFGCTYVSNPVTISSGSFAFSNVPNPADLQRGSLSKVQGFSFETNISGQRELEQIAILGLMDAKGKRGGGTVQINLLDANNQLIYSDSVVVNNPQGKPLYFDLNANLVNNAEYRLMLEADSSLIFEMLQNVSLPFSSGNNAELEIKQMLEASSQNLANTSASNMMPATILKFKNTIGFDESKISKLSVYPNPARDHLWLSEAFAKDVEVSVFNLSGQQKLKTILPEGEQRINLKNLASGVYLLKIEDHTLKLLVD